MNNERIAQIKGMLISFEHDNFLYSSTHKYAEYQELKRELAALEAGLPYKPAQLPTYAKGALDHARGALRGWISLGKKSRDRVNYVWGMTAEQHDHNLVLARQTIARQWGGYRSASRAVRAGGAA